MAEIPFLESTPLSEIELRARQSLVEDSHEGDEHFRADVSVEVHKVLKTHIWTFLKCAVEELFDLLDVALARGEVSASALCLVVKTFFGFNCRQLEVAAAL